VVVGGHGSEPPLRRRENRGIVVDAMEPDVEAVLERSFLGRLPREVVDPLVEGQVRMDVPAGTTIYREGEVSRAFLVISGLFRLYLVSGDGREVTVRYGRPSDVLGTALVVGGPMDVRAQTLAPSTILAIDVARLEEAARRDAAVAYAVSEELSRRLDETLQQIAINAFGSVKQRVASQLLELATTRNRDDGRLSAQLSQQELADAIGSVREVVARALRDLRSAGIVATSTDEVVILDAARLFDESWGSRRP
jgi:CRP/FNR family transcriptional regulator, cyclic AMP receptor protein